MFNLFSPISYYTPVLQVTLPYYLRTTNTYNNNYNFLETNTSYWDSNNYINPYITNYSNYATYDPNSFFNYLSGNNFNNPYLQYSPQYIHFGNDLNTFSGSFGKSEPPKATSPEKNTEAPPAKKTPPPKHQKETNIGSEFIKTANKYALCNENNNSHLKFCINDSCKIEDPKSQEWCTDFVTYVAKETYKNKGLSAPAGFGNHDVRRLKNWAINNNKFISTHNKSHKGKFIINNIRPGDIFILNENGASHTGFVTSVNKDGSFNTIEGNRNDRVTNFCYSPDYDKLSGFIRLT